MRCRIDSFRSVSGEPAGLPDVHDRPSAHRLALFPARPHDVRSTAGIAKPQRRFCSRDAVARGPGWRPTGSPPWRPTRIASSAPVRSGTVRGQRGRHCCSAPLAVDGAWRGPRDRRGFLTRRPTEAAQRLGTGPVLLVGDSPITDASASQPKRPGGLGGDPGPYERDRVARARTHDPGAHDGGPRGSSIDRERIPRPGPRT